MCEAVYDPCIVHVLLNNDWFDVSVFYDLVSSPWLYAKPFARSRNHVISE